jgi:DNA-binding MurR/RpiR family transcriptional regulator
MLAQKYALEKSIPFKEFKADWEQYGKSAGYFRNTEMAQYAVKNSNEQLLIAFPLGESRGTQLMMRIAKQYKIPTIKIQS